MKNISESQAALHEALNTYLHSNDYLPERLKNQLRRRANLRRNVLTKAGLREAIDKSLLSPASYEGLTNSLLDTQEEVDAWLQSLWDYVYHDGPVPE